MSGNDLYEIGEALIGSRGYRTGVKDIKQYRAQIHKTIRCVGTYGGDGNMYYLDEDSKHGPLCYGVATYDYPNRKVHISYWDHCSRQIDIYVPFYGKRFDWFTDGKEYIPDRIKERCKI